MTALWQQPAPAEPVIREKPVVTITDEEAEKTAIDTRAQINSRGYCLWSCQLLRGETIILLDEDKHEDLPQYVFHHPIYTLQEMELLEVLQVSTCRLVHLAKKLGGARVIAVRATAEAEKAEYQALVGRRSAN